MAVPLRRKENTDTLERIGQPEAGVGGGRAPRGSWKVPVLALRVGELGQREWGSAHGERAWLGFRNWVPGCLRTAPFCDPGKAFPPEPVYRLLSRE